jgi:hypothetical protein
MSNGDEVSVFVHVQKKFSFLVSFSLPHGISNSRQSMTDDNQRFLSRRAAASKWFAPGQQGLPTAGSLTLLIVR